MSFREAFSKFEKKLRSLTRPAPTFSAFNQANNLYQRELSRYNELRALGETEKAAELWPEVQRLEEEAAELRQDLDRPPSRDRVLEAMARNPDSELYQLAEAAVDAGTEELEQIHARIQELETQTIPELKVSYLAAVSELGNQYRELFQLSWDGMRIQKALPPEMRVFSKPRQAPTGVDHSIEAEETGKAFGHRPFFTGTP
nr:hypothetical protein 6 [Desulfobacteraceae bacterium]